MWLNIKYLKKNKRGPRDILCLFYHVGHNRKMAVCEPESRLLPDTEFASALILDFPNFVTVEINVCYFKLRMHAFCYSSPEGLR